MELANLITDTVEIDHQDKEGVIFNVVSSSRKEIHTTSYDVELGWCCTCEDYQFRKRFCKHMSKAKEYYAKHDGFLKLDKRVFTGFTKEEDGSVVL